MIIGLAGAHRTGKTTLGRKFAEANSEYSFVETSVSSMMRANGMDPSLDYPIEQRLAMQDTILTELDAIYAKYSHSAVFDRTPLDAAAYMLADVQRQNVTPEVQQAVARYLQRCFDVTNRRFTILLYVPPVLKLVAEEGKAPAEVGYVEHIAAIINGLKSDERCKVNHMTMPRAYLDLKTRVKAVRNAVGKLGDRMMNEAGMLEMNGIPFH